MSFRKIRETIEAIKGSTLIESNVSVQTPPGLASAITSTRFCRHLLEPQVTARKLDE